MTTWNFSESLCQTHVLNVLRGFGQKTYLDGYLVHLALTRVPVNTRTIMEVEKMAKKSVTKRGTIKCLLFRRGFG